MNEREKKSFKDLEISDIELRNLSVYVSYLIRQKVVEIYRNIISIFALKSSFDLPLFTICLFSLGVT